MVGYSKRYHMNLYNPLDFKLAVTPICILLDALSKLNRKHNLAEQGSETSGRNRFLPGRMEETGKKVFLPVSSGRKWKKLEESGRNWKKCT